MCLQQFWNMWSGGGKHYGFLNQPVAGAKNFGSFLQAVIPLLDKAGVQEARQIFVEHETVSQKAMDDMWRRKLGLTTWTADLDELLQRSPTIHMHGFTPKPPGVSQGDGALCDSHFLRILSGLC